MMREVEEVEEEAGGGRRRQEEAGGGRRRQEEAGGGRRRQSKGLKGEAWVDGGDSSDWLRLPSLKEVR